MLKTEVPEILYYFEVNKLAAEIAWMLVEDTKIMGQRQKENIEYFILLPDIIMNMFHVC